MTSVSHFSFFNCSLPSLFLSLDSQAAAYISEGRKMESFSHSNKYHLLMSLLFCLLTKF